MQPILTPNDFKICFESWFDELRNYISFRTWDTDLATDIVQDAFTKLWEKGYQYEGKATRALLYRMASDLWISHYRKHKREGQLAEMEWITAFDQTDANLLSEELLKQLNKELQKMSEDVRTTFLMSRTQSMSYPTIAELLQVSVKTVEKRMSIALKQLRKEIDYHV
jgi:RNA polymerase sigma-70 factor (ECF subfamily)